LKGGGFTDTDKYFIGNKFKILDKEVEVIGVEIVRTFPTYTYIYTVAYINDAGDIKTITITRNW
jgi:hypothetical protein